jgi:modulator of FtsH protease HflK
MRYLRYALLLVLIGYLLTGVKQVLPGERAVVRRFGRVVDLPGPGLWIGLPAGMDRVDHVSIDLVRRVRVGYEPDAEQDDLTTPPGQLLTGDHNLVNIQVMLDYAVGTGDDEIVDYVVQGDRVEGIIARAAEAALAEWVAGGTVDEVLIRGKTELPAILLRQTQVLTDPYRLGVSIQAASVAYLLPPGEVKDAFDEVNRAQTAVRTREHIARQEASRLFRQAQAEKDTIEKMTTAYVKEQLVTARAEAEAFELRLAQYRQLRRDNPHVLAAIWWDEIGKLFTQMKNNGRIDLLDNHLAGDGLDITVAPAMPKKR